MEVLVHVVPQVVLGDAQITPHVLPPHTWPVGHAFPQVPQFLPSVVVSVQAPPQND
jgi:hypothetical protein